MWVSADDRRIRYMGRMDWNEKGEPLWVFPGSSAEFVFTGDVLRIHVENFNEYWENYLGCVLDQAQSAFYLKKNGESVIEVRVPENESGIHRVLFFKRQDSCHEMRILGFEIGEGERLLELPPVSKRRIEVYGDSVSAGEVVEAIDDTEKKDPDHQGGFSNSWYSFPWVTARLLNAQLHDIAQGGIALMDGQGWFHEPEQVGMESAWDKVRYNKTFGELTKWDFSKYVPQVVIVAIGQNDSHPADYMKDDLNCDMAVCWREHYKEFLKKLRGVYPKAWIVCCTTLLEHDKNWDNSIGMVVDSMKDEKIRQFLFKRNGVGTPGHPRIPEQFEMAGELADYLENTLRVFDDIDIEQQERQKNGYGKI